MADTEKQCRFMLFLSGRQPKENLEPPNPQKKDAYFWTEHHLYVALFDSCKPEKV